MSEQRWLSGVLAAQRASSRTTVGPDDLARAARVRRSLGMTHGDYNNARPGRAARNEELDGFHTPPMQPHELLHDPESNPELDALATEFLASHDRVEARRAAGQAAWVRHKRAQNASIISDLLDAGHTGPSVFAVILASPQYAAAKAADPAWEVPAWVADEIRRQRP